MEEAVRRSLAELEVRAGQPDLAGIDPGVPSSGSADREVRRRVGLPRQRPLRRSRTGGGWMSGMDAFDRPASQGQLSLSDSEFPADLRGGGRTPSIAGDQTPPVADADGARDDGVPRYSPLSRRQVSLGEMAASPARLPRLPGAAALPVADERVRSGEETVEEITPSVDEMGRGGTDASNSNRGVTPQQPPSMLDVPAAGLRRSSRLEARALAKGRAASVPGLTGARTGTAVGKSTGKGAVRGRGRRR